MKKVNLTIATLILILPICLLYPLITQSKPRVQRIILYTPYTSQSVTPGKNLTYSIEVINRTTRIQDVNFSFQGIPNSWHPTLTASANTIQQIAIKPKDLGSKDSKNISLDLNVPLKIKKGNYHFKVIAKTDSGLEYVLPLSVKVTKQGIFKTELEVNQANMEGYADSDFNYNITLNNRTAKEQNYALTADALPGWDVRFKVSSDFVTSVTLASNESKNIYVKVTSPQKIKADTYNIKIRATSGTTSDQATLETVIKGKYNMDLTTVSGRLSTEVTAGSEKDIKLLIKNTGTVPLRDIKLTASTPADWSVEFGNKKINHLNPGESTSVNATIKASEKAIAGDYRLQISADTPDVSSKAAFRITVNKSVIWGSVGIFIILFVGGGISYLIKKYGRR